MGSFTNENNTRRNRDLVIKGQRKPKQKGSIQHSGNISKMSIDRSDKDTIIEGKRIGEPKKTFKAGRTKSNREDFNDELKSKLESIQSKSLISQLSQENLILRESLNRANELIQ